MKYKTFFQKLCAAIAAVAVWQIAACMLNSRILLASPVSVASRLMTIWRDEGFLSSVWFSFSHIVLGFFCALALGLVMAYTAYRFKPAELIFKPYIVTVKSVPVASFIVIALVWLKADNLSLFISFLMVIPIIYTNILQGLKATDKAMLEMAEVFRLSRAKRLRYILLPQVSPFMLSACSVGLGLSWKAGVAAEVIGIPSGSIGERLYDAKIYLETTDLFAWTVIIVAISIGFEKLVLFLLEKLLNRVGGRA